MKLGIAMLAGLIPLLAGPALAAEEVLYKQGDTQLKGHLAYDDKDEGPRPGVLVVHEWWGLNDYAKSRADMLAEEGYVALAVDMYGEGKVTEHPQEAGQWAAAVSRNAELGRQRFLAAYELLRADPRIGYCFGGGVVLNMALVGVDLRGVVSFHGSLPQQPAAPGTVKAKILVCHGGSDPLTTQEQIQTFEKNLTAAKADWELNIYGGAKHSFTNPEADLRGMDALAYSPTADRRSWRAMEDFFAEIFGR